MQDIKNEIKGIIIQSGFTMSEVIDEINKKYNRKDTLANLSGKLSRGTIKYRECLEIADILGYEIQWIKLDKKLVKL